MDVWPDSKNLLLIALYAEGLTFTQIAAKLEVTKGAVSGRLRRMKKANERLVLVRPPKPAPKPKVKPKVVIRPKTFVSPRYTILQKDVNKSMSKAEMREMLKLAVENTK